MQTLATAFNRMTGRLEEQTGALRSREYPARHPPRVHRGGAVERHRGRDRGRSANRILLINRSAEALLQQGQEELEGKELGSVSPDLDEFMRGEQGEANVMSSPSAASARSRSSGCATRTERADLRRHHRPADRPAARGMVGHRAADRA